MENQTSKKLLYIIAVIFIVSVFAIAWIKSDKSVLEGTRIAEVKTVTIENVSPQQPQERYPGFDETGIIDLKNEGTIRGSCVAVGSRLRFATDQIYEQILKTPSQGQDAQWKKRQEADDIREFEKNGAYWSKELQKGSNKYVPPSQMNDYLLARGSAMLRFIEVSKQDPWQAVNAWNYCGEVYGFLK